VARNIEQGIMLVHFGMKPFGAWSWKDMGTMGLLLLLLLLLRAHTHTKLATREYPDGVAQRYP